MSDYWTNLYKIEWRKLGFYYKTNENEKQWLFFGSKNGLLNFNNCIDHHIQYQKNISDDSHYGPHNYLKLMTWDKPYIDLNLIAGRKEDFENMKRLFSSGIKETIIGCGFVINEDYSLENSASIKVKIMNNNFDPDSMDDW